MSSVFPLFDASSVSVGLYRPPRQLLAGCVLASVVLHALAFVLLPGRGLPPAELSAPVLEVAMVTVAQPEPVVKPSPARNPMAIPQQRPVKPQQRVLPQTMELSQTVPSAPQVLPQAEAESLPAVTAARSNSPRVAESKAPASPALPVSPPLFNASYLRNPAPAYPAVARRNGDEGTVMLKVLVNAEGVPLRVDIDQSSGSSPLDSAALSAVKSWRFVPARQGVQNIEGWVRVPVVFRLRS